MVTAQYQALGFLGCLESILLFTSGNKVHIVQRFSGEVGRTVPPWWMAVVGEQMYQSNKMKPTVD